MSNIKNKNPRFRHKNLPGISRLAVLTCLMSAPAIAQDSTQTRSSDSYRNIEEITVTATKRGAQRVQDVPGAIQAITGSAIKDTMAVEFSDLAGLVPSLQFQDLGPGDKEYIIRGVNSSGTATVGVYYDEAVITARNKQDGGGRQADIELHDLARIEVLKGPQGTLYGASSMSGTIRFIPNEPDPTAIDFSVAGEVSGTKKGGTNFRTNAMFNMPIVENKLALRAVGWITDESGFIDNVRLNQKNINTNNVEGIRLALRWLPTEKLEFGASALIQNRKVGGSSRFSTEYQPGYRQNLDTYGFGAPELGELTNQDFTVNDWDESLELYGLKGQYDVGVGTISATSNFFKRDIDFRFDSTPIVLFFGAPAKALTFEPQSREVWSHELRFASDLRGPVNFVIGGFASSEDKSFVNEVSAVNDLGRPVGPFDITKDFFIDGPENAAIFGRIKDDKLKQQAIFGEITWDVTEKLALNFGGRYFNYSIKSSGLETKPFVGFNTSTRALNISSGSDSFQIKGNASYQVTDDHLVYFTASEGFRVGGTNDAAINPTGAPVPEGFDPDNLWNYEIGWKGAFLDNRVVFNTAGYIILWNDIQVEGFDPSGAFPIITNAGKAKIEGIELDLTLRPAAGLDFTFGGSWQHARITEDQPLANPSSPGFDPNAGLKGDRLPNVPKFQGFASSQYRWAVTSDFDGLFRIDISHRGGTTTELRRTSPFNVPLKSYTLVNLKAGIENDHWDLFVYAKNLFDTRAQIDAINTAQDPLSRITVRPLTIGARAGYRF